jgi:hypothetical protein
MKNNLTNKVIQYWNYLLIVFCLIVFVFIGTYEIQLPGLYYDEALFVNAASGGVTDLFIYKRLFGFPIMLMPYIGALKSWLYFPIFKFFGINFVTIRLPAVLLGALALGLTWRYVYLQFGVLPAIFFILMAAVEPGSLFHSRFDLGPTALMMIFRGGLLLFLTFWLEKGEKRYLIYALTCVLLGTFDKLNFLWIAISTFVAGIFVYPNRFRSLLYIKIKNQHLIFFGLVSLLLIILVLKWLNIDIKKEIGVTNIVNRLTYFFFSLEMTIKGAGVYNFLFQNNHQEFNEHGYVLFVLSIVAMWGLIKGMHLGKLPKRPIAYLGLVMLLLSLQVFITKKATGPHHFAVFTPFWLIFLAVGLSSTVYALQYYNKRFANTIGLLLVILVIASSLRLDILYLQSFKDKKINPLWDPASSTILTLELEKQKTITTVVTVDWGIGTNVQALSNNRLKVLDLWPLFNEGLNDNQANWIRKEFVDKGAAFVLHAQGREAFPQTRQHFLKAVQAYKYPLHQLFTIRTTDGRPYIEVYVPKVISKNNID